MSTARVAGVFALVVVVLAVIASVAPAPSRQTDRDIYEATANQFIVPDCSDLHCFRVLVAWTMGVVPGPSAAKWKAFAVIANASGAIAVLTLGLAWGLSLRASLLATAMSATGFGSLYPCTTRSPRIR